MTSSGFTAITSTSFKTVIDAISAQISVTTIVEVLAYAVPIAIVMVFAWWGIRKVSAMLMGAFRKGRLKA